MRNISSKYVLEIACFNVESCKIAQDAGADRIEFCSDYTAGGLTPNHQDILQARQLLHIPLHVIIRPRPGDFVYNNKEIEMMKYSIQFCNEQNIDGVVFGVLNSDGTINLTDTRELIELSIPMTTSFHRAIDETLNTQKALEEIVKLGFSKVLTSGGKTNAMEGIETLKKYRDTFGDKINIIPAGGIRSNNLEIIAKSTGCMEFHSAALISKNSNADTTEIKSLKTTLQML
jgi:copper homeostasis protein